MLFALKSRTVKFVRVNSSGGILPVKGLLWSQAFSRRLKFPIAEGIFPVIWLLDKSIEERVPPDIFSGSSPEKKLSFATEISPLGSRRRSSFLPKLL